MIVFVALMLIFVIFKPITIAQQEFKDVPMLNVGEFTLYELDTKGLKTIMTGKKALRFSNRYTVDEIDYTDNSNAFVANMKANYGIYKAHSADLKGAVSYVREDGITFNTDTMHYDTKTGIASTKDPYTAQKGESKMVGKGVVYDAKHKTMKSKKVEIRYKLEDK